MYDFRMRPSVPRRLSKEVLLVDLLHNIDRLPEDKVAILPRALAKAGEMNSAQLARAVLVHAAQQLDLALAGRLRRRGRAVAQGTRLYERAPGNHRLAHGAGG